MQQIEVPAKKNLDQEDQRIKVMELDTPEDATEESASIICGDWIHRIRPVIKNLSKKVNKVLGTPRRSGE